MDTWFSSQLWPFATLGWPEQTPEFKAYYSTNLLITGYDILFFWVARMIVMGLHFTGKVPFRAVYLHSLVRTGSGEKMSKSKGTGLDPVALNQQYGTDAMRFCLASMAAPGTDIVLSDDRLTSSRNFANKIWNAARFLFVNLDKFEQGGVSLDALAAPEVRANAPYPLGSGGVPLADAWLFARLASTVETVNDAYANYRFHEAAHAIYQFSWGDFCDWYIEWTKPDLQAADPGRAIVAWRNLFAAFDAALRLLHPLMPFLTEELWHQLPQPTGAKSIALDGFPQAQPNWKNAEAAGQFALIQEIITALRNIRAELKLDPKKKLAAQFSSAETAIRNLVEANRDGINRLAILSDLAISSERLPAADGAVRSTATFDVRIAYGDVVDISAEKSRITKEIDKLQAAIAWKERQLADETTFKGAREHHSRLEETLAGQRIELDKLRARLGQLG